MIVPEPIPQFFQMERSRRAFFIAYGASHIAKVAPVIKVLEKHGVECMLMALTVGYQSAKKLGLLPVSYKDFLPLMEQPEMLLERGQSLMDGNTHPDVDTYETRCYLGINYQDLIGQFGEEGAQKTYQRRGRQGFMPVQFMGRIIDALRPGIVVATSTPRTEEAGIRAAAMRGLPTLTMVDLFAPPSDPFLKRPVHADTVTVVSTEVRDRFIQSGLGADQVVVTGSPDFDALFDPSISERGREFRREAGWNGLTVVMWAGIKERESPNLPSSSAGTEFGTSVELTLRRWVASRRDVALIVRYHPNQYHEFAKQPWQERVYWSDPSIEPVAPLLHASDVVIQQVSTVGFEAALLKKKVLHLGFSSWMEDLDFDLSALGPSEEVKSLEQLIPKIEESVLGTLVPRMSVPDGPAAPRVAAEVIRLLEKKGVT